MTDSDTAAERAQVPEFMRAWMLGGDEPMRQVRLSVPTVERDQVLVRVTASGLNNADLTAPEDPTVIGFEVCGEIVAVGSDTDDALIGQRILGIAEGALAEYVAVHRRHLLPVPEHLSDVEAAATPTAFTTEWGALTAAQLNAGHTVLVTAASSSLGLVAVQLAKESGAGRVIATTRSKDKTADLERVGADVVLVTDNDALTDAVLGATDGVGAHVVLDHIGGEALDAVIAATADGGTVVSVGRLAGGDASLDLFALARRHVLLRSVSYGLTPPEVLGELFDGVAATLVPALVAGRVFPVVGATFAFDDAVDALELLRAGRTAGKIIVTVP